MPGCKLSALILLAALPAAAAGYPIQSWGFDSVWEVWFYALALIVAAFVCILQADRKRRFVLALPAFLFFPLAGILLFGSSFYLDSAFPKHRREPKVIQVKKVMGGWTSWVDTANAGGDKRVLVSSLGRDSGSVFLIETHWDEVREYPRSFLCFNLYDSPEPQRYSDTAAKAIALEIHRFDGWSGQGLPQTVLHYDFTVRRRGAAYALEGRRGGIDIGGTYAWVRDDTWMPFAPPSWARPTGYP